MSDVIDYLMDHERIRDAELHCLKAELAQLKAPPTARIIHDRGEDPRQSIRFVFEWLGFRHCTMVDKHIWETEPGYIEHVRRYAVEACVRAHAEVQVERLVETEEWDR